MTNNSNEPNDSQSTNDTKLINKTIVEPLPPVVEDLPSVPTPSPPNEMLSFEEWRKKIAEKSIERTVTKIVAPDQLSQSAPSASTVQLPIVSKQKPIPKRHRNFASFECGAKVVDSNPESESVQRILNEQTDEYMLNPCQTKIWFVVELCETIQPKNIELANFELYSSVPKEFNIQASDHYPTRDWSSLGTFNSLDERSVQRFQLQNNGFVKFIKIELLSHYGAEHFCPLSVVRIFGTSLFEEVERIDNMDTNQNIGVDEDESPLNEELVGEDNGAQNLFGTARDAVFNIVRKAAQALNGNNLEVLEHNCNNSVNSTKLSELIDFELIAIKLYPKVDKYLHKCNETMNNSINCLYLKAMFGQSLYELLIQQYLSLSIISTPFEQNLLFQCNSRLKNSSNESINIESTIDSQNLYNISPTKPIIDIVLDSKSVQNTTLDHFINALKDTDISVSSVTAEVVTTSESFSESSSVWIESEKSEDLSTIEVIISSNKELNNSESYDKTREEIRNVTNNEMNGQTSGGSVASVNSVPNGNNAYPPSGSAIGQSKESVVIRLSNRIKALEVNLSLSSQYLEELSLRYRKQMEEMQKAFNITISKLNDTNTRATERDLKQQESIALLETKLNSLSGEMSVLLRERESLNWHYIEVHIALMMIEAIVVIIFLFVCLHRLSQRINCLQSVQKPISDDRADRQHRQDDGHICHCPDLRRLCLLLRQSVESKEGMEGAEGTDAMEDRKAIIGAIGTIGAIKENEYVLVEENQ